MPTKKIIKNPDAPGGREDWKGRSPRWRLSLTHPQLSILRELMDEYFSKHPDKVSDPVYSSLAIRILEAIDEIQKPLVSEVPDRPLFG